MTSPYTNAFPGPMLDNDAVPLRQAHPGLTIREHFAAMAMQGILANALELGALVNSGIDGPTLLAATAQEAVAHADALILELNK